MFSSYKKNISYFIILVLVISGILRIKNRQPPLCFQQQLDFLVETVHHHFQREPNFWKLSGQLLIREGALPSNMVKGQNIISFTGKSITIGWGINGTMVMPGSQSFDITYHNLSRDECQKLLIANHKPNISLSFIKLSAFDVSSQPNRIQEYEGTLPLSVAQAQKICYENTNLMWTFK